MKVKVDHTRYQDMCINYCFDFDLFIHEHVMSNNHHLVDFKRMVMCESLFYFKNFGALLFQD